MYYKAALVLEGGAFRGLYTSGVLDALMDKDIQFDAVIGVSAGSLNGVNYIAKQYKRSFSINTKYRNDKEYIAVSNALKNESVINLDFLFKDHGLHWQNFDAEAYKRSDTDFVICATSLTTGNLVTFKNPEVGDDLIKALEASSSMPLISNPILTNRGLCLDGGIADSIPYKVAKEMGYDKIVVVRTRPRDYRKSLTGRAAKKIYELTYKDYPSFARAAINRPVKYNETCDELEALEKSKDIFVIAPDEPIKVSRLEKNQQKLQDLYNLGKKNLETSFDSMVNYIKQ